MPNECLSKLGAAFIANAINDYLPITTAEEILNMKPVPYSTGTEFAHDDTEVYAINHGCETILAEVDYENGKVTVDTVKWWTYGSDRVSMSLLEKIGAFLKDKNSEQLWIYPTKIVTQSKSGSEYEEELDLKLSDEFLDKFWSVLRDLIQDIEIYGFDPDYPNIHLNKFYK